MRPSIFPRFILPATIGLALVLTALLALWKWHSTRAIDPLVAESLMNLTRPLSSGETRILTDSVGDQYLKKAGTVAKSIDPSGIPQTVEAWQVRDKGRDRIDAILLADPVSQGSPVPASLLKSRSWRLAKLNDAGILLVRGPKSESAPPLDSPPASGGPAARAVRLSNTAGWLACLDRTADARSMLDEALKLDDKNPAILSRQAALLVRLQRIGEAMDFADRALKVDSKFPPALSIKTQILLASKQNGLAYDTSAILIATTPEDPAALFLHARAAHEVEAYQDEIRTLEKLVALALKSGKPAGKYRIYLAQSHASNGDAKRALAIFAEAREDPELTAEQRAYIDETVARIRQKAGM